MMRRLKNEGSKEAILYESIALSTLGKRDWESMKKGTLNWSMIDDRYFSIAEFLTEQLETIPNDHDSTSTNK